MTQDIKDRVELLCHLRKDDPEVIKFYKMFDRLDRKFKKILSRKEWKDYKSWSPDLRATLLINRGDIYAGFSIYQNNKHIISTNDQISITHNSYRDFCYRIECFLDSYRFLYPLISSLMSLRT